jgi:hypothetical protein
MTIMPARKKAAPRRRGPKMTSILGLAEGYVQANIVTEKLMGTNPISFIVGDAGPSFAVSGGGISLIEIVRNPSLLNTIGQRAMNPETLVNIGIQSALANVAFRFGRKALRRPISLMNRNVFKPLALGVRL